MGLFKRAIALLAFVTIALPARAASDSDFYACRQTADVERGIAACTRIIANEAEPARDRALALYNRGNLHGKNGDLDRAIADYTEALRIQPELAGYTRILNLRAGLYERKRSYELALEDYENALGRTPEDVAALVGRGNCYLVMKQYDRAMADYNQAIRLNPRFAGAFINRGYAHAVKGELERAIVDQDEAIRLDAKNFIAYTHRGATHGRKGNHDHAIADFSAAIRINPGHAPAYCSRAIAYSAQGDHDRAMVDFNEAIRLDPNYFAVYRGRGFLHFRTGSYEAAAADFTRVLQHQPDDGYMALWLYLAGARVAQPQALVGLEKNAAKLNQTEWPYPIVELFLGPRTVEATLAAADRAEHVCEAQFYIAQWHLLRSDRAQAAALLKSAADICPKGFVEFKMAPIELERLQQ